MGGPQLLNINITNSTIYNFIKIYFFFFGKEVSQREAYNSCIIRIMLIFFQRRAIYRKKIVFLLSL